MLKYLMNSLLKNTENKKLSSHADLTWFIKDGIFLKSFHEYGYMDISEIQKNKCIIPI